MENVTRPGQLRAALILIIITSIFDILNHVLFEASALATQYKVDVFVFYISAFATSLLYTFLLYKLYKGRRWTRVAWCILFVFAFLIGLSSTNDYVKTPMVLAFFTTITTIMELVSLVLLWHPETTRWFNAVKSKHQSESAIVDASGHLDNLPSVNSESVQQHDESMRSGFSYKRLLKIIRAIRALYVVSMTLNLINIAAFYGLISSRIDRFPMPQNLYDFANADRSVDASLVVMILISIFYVVMETVLDKKLQTLPKTTIDRSYSGKAIMFLAFLYTFFFLSLNHRIIISFFYFNPVKKPGVWPLIYLGLSDLTIIYFVFLYLIQKIENRKHWKYFWIFALLMIFCLGITENMVVYLGMAIFVDPVTFLFKILR